MWRRFELETRYWEARCEGPTVEMRWGEARAPQKTFSRHFPTEAEAELFLARQIEGQQARGYVETAQAAAPPPPSLLTVERFQRFERTGHFLEIAQDGKKLTIRGGRSVDGHDHPNRDQLDVQYFATAAEASAAFDARCSNARQEGGVVVEAEPTHTTAVNLELERECELSPDRPEPWSVYADWLIAQGDARGEIAALQVAGKLADANRRLAIHLRELCGIEVSSLIFEYRHGFATHCSIPFDLYGGGELLEDMTRALLASPIGRFLESLRFGITGINDESDWTPTIQAVASSPRAGHIRALCFDDFFTAVPISEIRHGDFSGVWPKLPALERLRIRSGGGGRLGLVEHANLRTLIRESGGLALAELEEIVAARLPRLEHLEIWFGQEMYGAECQLPSIRPILDGEKYPALRHLGIVNCELVEDVVPELARSRILPQLTSLDLSKGVMADHGAFALIENAAAFRHLTSIDVSENYLGEADLKRLRVVLPNIVAGEQRAIDDEDDRYAAVGE